jgi:hypothetical protein
MEKITDIILLVCLMIVPICTIIVIIDYHKQWKLIEKKIKDKE